MTIFEYCGLILILVGILGIIFKRNIFANGMSLQIIFLGLMLLACRGLSQQFPQASYELVFMLIFISNVFFMLLIGTVYRLIKDFKLKNEE